MSQPGELYPDQLRRIFESEIRPERYGGVRHDPAGTTTLVIVGGQPGAGKTRALDHAARAHPGIVPIVGDDLRRYHLAYDDVMASDPLRMPEVTAHAANAWVHMSLDYLRGKRRPVLLETTLRQPGAVEATLRQFRSAGYATELRVLAVPEELSRMGTLTRYVGQVAEDGAGRWAPSRFHDAAYTQAPDTVGHCVAAGLVDRAIIIDRNLNILADVTIDPGGRRQQADELQAVIASGRDVSTISPAQGRTWLAELTGNAHFLADQREVDADLLATVRRLDGRADAVAAAAWPTAPERAAAVANLPDREAPSTRQALSERIKARMEITKGEQ